MTDSDKPKEKSRPFLYRYREYFGRNGTLSGTFFLTGEELDSVMDRSGYADDVLGKHSEVNFSINNETLTLVTNNVEFLAEAERLGVCLETGFNPVDYLPDDDDEEDKIDDSE